MEIIKLNLIPNGVNPVCHASQYDNGRVIRGELFDGLTPYTLASGDVVVLNVRKPDNHVVTETLTATAGNSYVDIVTTEQMTACFGENLCELKITNGNTEIGTINFYMIVERDVLADGDPSQSVIEDLEAMVQEAVGDNYYTKTETDNKLALKANAADVYTKTETDNKLDDKADAEDVYTKTEIDEDLDEIDAELERKADKNGSYEDMTVGNAEQLVATVSVEDKVPYNFRTSGGSADIGNRENDKIVGGTVAFNQLIKNGNFENVNYWSVNNVNNGSIAAANNKLTYTVIAPNASQSVVQNISIISGHKYFRSAVLTSNKNTRVRLANYYNNSLNDVNLNDITANAKTIIQTIFNSGYTGNCDFYTYTNVLTQLAENDFVVLEKYILIDLTQMFGATIADYIYSLEQGTAGAGVAWFKSLFPKPYYPYNAGELMSVKTSAHVTTGFNQFDEETELGNFNWNTGEKTTNNQTIRSKNYIKVVPNTAYKFTFTGNYIDVYFYAADYSFISPLYVSKNSGSITTPSNCAYIRFACGADYGTNYKHDICINLSWSGARNGEYQPYVKNTYELDSDLELRGIPKLDANNKLYYDGDTYSSDGSVKRKYIKKIYDGSSDENWILINSANGLNNFSINISDYVGGSANLGIANFRGAQNTIMSQTTTEGYWLHVDKVIYIRILQTTAPDLASFRQYLANNNLEVVYELAEPTTEQAEPYQDPQIVDDFGTEEYIDTRDIAIPVGHDTKYPVNLRDKLQHLPDLASSDGVYHIQQTGAQMSLVADTSNGRLTALEAKVPAPPTADGTYRLTVTVSNGSATYAWISV